MFKLAIESSHLYEAKNKFSRAVERALSASGGPVQSKGGLRGLLHTRGHFEDTLGELTKTRNGEKLTQQQLLLFD